MGTMTHLNIAKCKSGGDIQSAVAESLANLPPGVSHVALVGTETAPRTNNQIAVYISPD